MKPQVLVFIDWYSPGSVSYTHLDVYKRQVIIRTLRHYRERYKNSRTPHDDFKVKLG